ncbi:hypothetical protein ACVBEH_14120 [Roseateles sp. GG27B]
MEATLDQDVLATLPEGTHLYYIDSGCEISPLGSDRFNQLDSLLEKQQGLFFKIPFLERNFSKPSLLAEFSAVSDTWQIQATWFGIQATAKGRDLIDQWLKLCWDSDFARLRADPATPNSPHRHDQSILSCLLKSCYSDLKILPWEDFFAPWLYHKDSEILLAPIHAMRSRGEHSSLNLLIAQSTKSACERSRHKGSVVRFIQELPLRIKSNIQDELVILINRLRRLTRNSSFTSQVVGVKTNKPYDSP